MITRIVFHEAVNEYFSFLEDEYKYINLPVKTNNSLLYEVKYKSSEEIICITYEVMGFLINIFISKLIDGIPSDYDDKIHTTHLNQLTKSLSDSFTKELIDENHRFFSKYSKPNDLEKAELLKRAISLRLCMRSQTQFS